MRHHIVLAPEAVEDLKRLDAHYRVMVRAAMEKHLSEEDWFDYQLENDPRFLRRIESVRRNLRAGLGVPLEELEEAE